MTELKNRGVEDILIAVVDGLKISRWRCSRLSADDRRGNASSISSAIP